ncbi:SdrD B-like domain-containing protein [Spirosoma sordidisoli]|uniref:PKD/Chitinase domain-containing protein n=1 Tax=Spirosoma sordidisoli TaxID=2502893 RepID=A0A4Q2UYF6_9BACT|nr:SdrD B-like domain-containing protein [Spirosoma sordidisoli]RYC72129.1 hypothetical protein EQG79_08445 [Spirosoma sordidisoli]
MEVKFYATYLRYSQFFKTASGRGFGLFIGLISLLVAGQANAQISGVVYRDFNESGTRQYTAVSTLTGEIGVGGVTVTVYTATGAIAGTAVTSSTTATQGQYSITPSVVGPYRVQFANLPSGYFPGQRGTQSGTTVQFVNTTTLPVSATISLGINHPADYCQANPNYLVPCYVNGNSLTTTGNAGTQGVLVSLPYSSTGNSPTETALALNQQIGTVYGLAYQRAANQLYSSAFVKRHAGLGPGGAGAIYLTRVVSGTLVSSVFTTLSAGTVASNTDRGLPANITTGNHDPSVYDQVGKAGLGDIELSEDGTTLYAVNLADRSLYKIPITNPTSATPTAGTPTSYTLPVPSQRTGSVFRPFALKVYRDRVYVGGVTTNEGVPTSTTINFGAGSTTGNLITRDTTNMKAYVYEFNPTNNSFTQVLSFPLTYKKGATNNDRSGVDRAEYWLPWISAPPATGSVPNRFARADLPNCSYPQPMLTGIEFDVDGSMILSLRDRLGDQYGNNNYGTNTSNTTTLYRAIAPGDILRAGKCDPAINQWTIERAGRVCNGTATAGATNGQGFGGGEYYYQDAIAIPSATDPYHAEMSEGALAVFPGTGDVSSIVIDPTDQIDAGGIRRFRNATGTGSPSTSVQVYASGDVATFGKANGLGDLELTCSPAPIEIGNRVWYDGVATGANGTQDNGLSPLATITVQLYLNGTQVASTTTDANGEYYFNSTNVSGGLLPNTAYELRVPLSQTALSGSGYLPAPSGSGSDPSIDNDAVRSGNNAVVSFTTGDYGENNHTLDFGFVDCPTITNPSGTTAVCTGTPIRSLTVATTTTVTSGIQFVYFTAPQSGTAMYSGGTSLGTATPASGTAGIGNVAFPANTGTTAITYYVYAILNPAPAADGCRPSQLIQVTINPNPAVTLSSTSICVGRSAVLTATGGTSYTLTPGSLTSATGSFTVTPSGTTTYTVTAANASGCTSTTSGTVTVNQLPTPSLNSTSICVGRSAVLTATGGTSYTLVNTGTVSASGSFTVTPSGTTTYTVVATNASSCTARATGVVTVNQLPTPTLSSTSICAGQTATLTATGGTSYTLTPGGLTSATGSFTVTPSGTTTYTVTAANANGCTATTTGTVTVRPVPVPTATGGTITCVATATVTGSSSLTGSTYSWTGPLAFTSAAQSFTTSTPGTYTLTVTANGCASTSSATAVVTLNTTAPQSLSLTSNRPLSCTAATVTLTASSTTGGLSYVFAGPGLVSTSGASATVSQIGTYTVTATAPNGCTASATTTVSQTLTSATLVQGSCASNNTNSTAADDYYTLGVRALPGVRGPSNRFEVLLNGTVLNPGGTTYGQSVTVGTPTTFKADGSTTYTLVIRDLDVPTCQTTQTTNPVASCSTCEPLLCPKVSLQKR